MTGESVSVPVTLPADWVEWLGYLALARGTTVPTLVRDAVRHMKVTDADQLAVARVRLLHEAEEQDRRRDGREREFDPVAALLSLDGP